MFDILPSPSLHIVLTLLCDAVRYGALPLIKLQAGNNPFYTYPAGVFAPVHQVFLHMSGRGVKVGVLVVCGSGMH